MTVSAGVSHDITLEVSGQKMGFMVAPGSHIIERADDFAPRIATGNDPTLREGIWDAWSMNGAIEGIDQLTFVNRNKIYRSDHDVFLRKTGAIQLNTAWQVGEGGGNAITAPMLIDFSTGGVNYIVAGQGTKVRWVASPYTAAWTDSTTTLAASCVWLHKHGIYVFAAVGDANAFYRSSDLITWTQVAAGQGARCFCTWTKGTVTELVLGTGATIKRSTDSGVTWGAAINVGDPGTNVTGLAVAFGLVVIGKEDGLYYYDGANVVEIANYHAQLNAGNFKAIVYHDGFLYTHMLGRVFKLSFSTGGLSNLVDITPEMIGDLNKEIYGHGIPVWAWSAPSGVYVAFDDGESIYPELLLYNGLGWHQEFRGASGKDMYGGGYSYGGSKTWVLYDSITKIYRRHITLRDLPYGDYNSSGQFDTSDYDAGLPFMNKAFRDVTIEARNFSGTGAIQVWYSIDKGVSFTLIASVSVNGKTTLAFPSAVAIGAKQIRMRFIIQQNSASSSPVMERFSLNFLNRPNPVYAHALRLLIAPNQELRDGTRETDAVSAKIAFLRNTEYSPTPVTFVDAYGFTNLVYVTKTSISRPAEQERAVGTSEEAQVSITMVTARPLAVWGEVYWGNFYWV